ncbi:PREDICTED: DNA-binding protein RHL1-like isoform X2 [Ipomoea nil]|uniref:DNA-binding protein RHL1-like isoform X2 n=1 Tax=Ipomoea nil TaxID=35883 RepID=UPI000900AC09|nr:PREDICTED: DNA-binding protein RHL1-like isoform X2 [Ipomoea nil]
MVRRGGKKEENAPLPENPEVEERKRLKKLAFSKRMLSETPVKAATAAGNALQPSKTVIKHHGKDLIRKSQRSKSRFLFSFPGLLAPVSGGKIGELKDLGSKNPILYLDFPQGQMKLFGTIVYPKNRYLSLQFSRGGKNVVCDDYFDNMIVFSDAWWIGRKDENPNEVRLEFPKELNVNAEYDFKGGAGAACNGKEGINRTGINFAEQESPKHEQEDDSTEDQSNVREFFDITPIRHSARTAKKTFNFADASSGDDFVVSDAETSDEEEQKVGVNHSNRNFTSKKKEKSPAAVFDVDKDVVILDPCAEKSTPGAKVASTSKELPHSNHSSLVQATISTMFKKVEEKKELTDLKQKIVHKKVASSKKKGKVGEETKAGRGGITTTKKQLEAEDEEIEEFSSTSQDMDMDGSDEDWTV